MAEKEQKKTPADNVRTFSHQLDSLLSNLAHAGRHADVLSQAPTGPSVPHNIDHMAHHLAKARQDAAGLRESIEQRVPGVKAENAKIDRYRKEEKK